MEGDRRAKRFGIAGWPFLILTAIRPDRRAAPADPPAHERGTGSGASTGARARRPTMNRFLLSALAAFAAFFGLRAIVHALASDETKIRWVVEDMASGFNDTRMSRVLGGLSKDFLDETWGADREMVRAGLAHMFFEEKDPETKHFLYRVDIPRDELAIDVQGESASMGFVANFYEVHGASEKLAWKARIHAALVKSSDGWKIRRSENKSIEGTRLHG
jgi:hypothetical protein